MKIVSPDEFETEHYEDHVPNRYREFQKDEGIPAHTDFYVKNINEVEVGNWDQTGQKGAFVNLHGAEGVVDLQIHELEPGGETKVQRHLYDELVYVSQGDGVTTIGEGDNEVNFEWNEHSLFFIPPNTPYRHVNMSSENPARLVSETPLPELMTLLLDDDFIFNNDQEFWETAHEEGYYSSSGSIYEGENFPAVWESNFIPDIKKFKKIETWQKRGAGGQSVRFPFSNSSMWSHISEFPVGTYKKAHRHGPGANVFILSGEGYSLMWRDGIDEVIKFDWEPYSVITPPARWYHQHFNTGSEPARYFAMHCPDLGMLKRESPIVDPYLPENQIEYVDEDPAIRERFEEELEKEGLESNMPEGCYTDPDYEF